MEALDGRVGRLEHRVDTFEMRVDSQFAAVTGRLDRLDGSVGDLRVDLARVGQRIEDHVGNPRAHQAA